MKELRLVPAALVCWGATWVVLTTRSWVWAVLVIALAALASLLVRQPGQALVCCATGMTTTALSALRIAAASAPTPPLLSGRLTENPRALDHGVWLLHVSGETIFYRAPELSARAGDSVRMRVVETASSHPGTHDHVLRATSFEITQQAQGIQAVMNGLREGLYGASISRGDGLLPAMVLGDTRGIDTAVYADVGLAHLSAVSGANIAIVTGAVLLLARALTLSPRMQLGCAAVSLGAFVLLVGPEPSVLRAAVTGSIGLFASLNHRRSEPIHALCLGTIGLLLWDSDLAVSYGFALSVAATAGIVALFPLIFRNLGALPLPKPIAQGLSATLAAETTTAPIITLMTGRLPTISILANLLAAPAVAPITILGMAATICPPLRSLFIHLVQPFTWWISHIAQWLSGWSLNINILAAGWYGIYLVILIYLWILALIWARRWGALLILIGICTLTTAVY